MVRLANEVDQIEKQIAATRDAEARPAGSIGLTALGQAPKPVTQAAGSEPSVISMFEVQDAEIRIEMEKADNEIVRREKEQDEVAHQLKALQARLLKGPALEQDLAALMRQLDTLKVQYANIQGKKFNSSMAAKLETDTSKDTYKIIDEASLPVRPVFPDRRQIILMGIAGGILLGLGAAVGREFLDPTLRSEEEAAAVLNLPVLASIPEVAIKGIVARKSIAQRAGTS